MVIISIMRAHGQRGFRDIVDRVCPCSRLISSGPVLMLRFHLSFGLKHRVRIHLLRAAGDAFSVFFFILLESPSVMKISSCAESGCVQCVQHVKVGTFVWHLAFCFCESVAVAAKHNVLFFLSTCVSFLYLAWVWFSRSRLMFCSRSGTFGKPIAVGCKYGQSRRVHQQVVITRFDFAKLSYTHVFDVPTTSTFLRIVQGCHAFKAAAQLSTFKRALRHHFPSSFGRALF